MEQKRIGILDSFRFLAIISVMLYHYTCRWDSLYPYGKFFRQAFLYGNLGVEFFFIISGFVISYTLENTAGLSAFFKNRFIRLFPPMLFWSIITFSVVAFLDTSFIFPPSHQLKNLLFSLTFINPYIGTVLFKNQLYWLNGSYWSLWVEVQFYVIAALLFFFNKQRFFRNILVLSTVLLLLHFMTEFLFLPIHQGWLSGTTIRYLHKVHRLDSLINLTPYICFFSLGVIFHYLYKGGTIRLFSLNSCCIGLLLLVQLYLLDTVFARLYFILMIALFLLMIYKRHYLSFLEHPLLMRIGVISYSIYLAHEMIGVLLINKFGGYLGRWSPLSVLIVMVLMVVLAELSYRFIEKKTARLLKKLMFKDKRTGHAGIPPQIATGQPK
jgi:peptidoglycan/LPS O-acetylase OafA/YrhL